MPEFHFCVTSHEHFCTQDWLLPLLSLLSSSLLLSSFKPCSLLCSLYVSLFASNKNSWLIATQCYQRAQLMLLMTNRQGDNKHIESNTHAISCKFDTYLAFFFMVVDGWASTPWSNCCCLSESAEFRCWNTFVLACRILHGLSHSQYKIESQYRTPTFTYINRLAPVPLVTCLFRRDQQTTHCFYLIVRYIWRTTTAMIVSKSSQCVCSIDVCILLFATYGLQVRQW